MSNIAKGQNISPGKSAETFVCCSTECLWGGCECVCMGEMRIM